MPGRKKRMDVWAVLSLAILAVYGLFLIYPLIRLLMESVTRDGQLTAEYFAKFFSHPYYGTTLAHSFALSIASTLVSLAIGVPLAYFYNLYEIKGRNLIQIIIIQVSVIILPASLTFTSTGAISALIRIHGIVEFFNQFPERCVESVLISLTSILFGRFLGLIDIIFHRFYGEILKGFDIINTLV